MGLFGGIGEAKYSEGGVYLKPGVYRLQVIACKYLKTRTGKDAFVVECKILESTEPSLLPGGICSWMVTLDKEPALGNIKQFLQSILACDEGQIDETVVEAAIGPTNPLANRIVRASAVNIKTKANRDFTKVKFMTDSAEGAAAAAKDFADNNKEAA